MLAVFVPIVLGCSGSGDQPSPRLAHVPLEVEQNVEKFLDELDRAIIIGDVAELRNRFQESSSVVVVGPPPKNIRLNLLVEEFVQRAIGDGTSPDYGRHREVQSIALRKSEAKAVAISKVDEYRKDPSGSHFYIYFFETVVLQLNGSRMSISEYIAEYPEHPKRF